jgi:hypothetical protein
MRRLARWDYRINVPYARLNSTFPRARSGAAMVGVVEDTVNAAATLQNAVHVNNSIWLPAVDVDGVLRVKVIASQRGATSAAVDNIGSLSMGWNPVGPAGPRFLFEKPSAVGHGERGDQHRLRLRDDARACGSRRRRRGRPVHVAAGMAVMDAGPLALRATAREPSFHSPAAGFESSVPRVAMDHLGTAA